MTNAGVPNIFPSDRALFKYKEKVTGSTGSFGIKALQIMAPLKYLSNFWRNLKIWFINSEASLILTWSKNCAICNAASNQAAIFKITDTKLHVPFVTLSTQYNAKVSQQLSQLSRMNIIQNQQHRMLQTYF